MSQQKKRNKNKPASPRRQRKWPTWSTDELMKKLFISLVEDFRTEMGPEYKKDLVKLLRSSDPNCIKDFRQQGFPDRLQAPPF